MIKMILVGVLKMLTVICVTIIEIISNRYCAGLMESCG